MRVSVIAAIAILLAAWLGALLSHAGQQSNLDDDRVYLYSANFAVSAPDRYEAESARWLERLTAAGYAEESLARFSFRRQYVTNYVAQAGLMAGIRQAWPWPASGLAYPSWFRSVVVVSGLALAAFGVAMALWMAARLPDDQRMAALFGFVGLAGLAFLPVLLFYRISTDIDLLYPLRALTLIVQPGHELTPFGIQNRNVATMLLVAATFARWRGATAAVYWLVFAAATMHATYGALILLILLALDAVLDPRRLWRPGVLIPITATVAWGAVFGVSFGAFTAPLTALVLLLGAVAAILAVALAPLDRLAPVKTLRALPPRRGEAVLLTAAVVAVLAAVAVAASMTSGLERVYLVDELSGRPLGLLRVPLLLSLAAIVTAALPERLMKPLTLAAAIGALASIPVGLFLLTMRYDPTPTETQILAALPDGPTHGAPASSETERAVYYSIAHAIDSGRLAP